MNLIILYVINLLRNIFGFLINNELFEKVVLSSKYHMFSKVKLEDNDFYKLLYSNAGSEAERKILEKNIGKEIFLIIGKGLGSNTITYLTVIPIWLNKNLFIIGSYNVFDVMYDNDGNIIGIEQVTKLDNDMFPEIEKETEEIVKEPEEEIKNEEEEIIESTDPEDQTTEIVIEIGIGVGTGEEKDKKEEDEITKYPSSDKITIYQKPIIKTEDECKIQPIIWIIFAVLLIFNLIKGKKKTK